MITELLESAEEGEKMNMPLLRKREEEE